MEPGDDLQRRISAIAVLDQPLRRDLYRLLSERGGWVTRDAASAALGVARSVAAFHLDKLVEAGVVDVRFERTTGRTGPGAGRPAKLYRRGEGELSASIPDRRYDLAGLLLVMAIAEAERSGAPVADCLHAIAEAAGRAIGTEAASQLTDGETSRPSAVELLAQHGYEPEVSERGEITLVNCPFHRLADEHRDLVCGMNLDFVTGLLGAIGPADRLAARLAPRPGRCCVQITAA